MSKSDRIVFKTFVKIVVFVANNSTKKTSIESMKQILNAYCTKHSISYDFPCNYMECLKKVEQLGLIEFETNEFCTFIIPLKKFENAAYDEIDVSELTKILNKDFCERKTYFSFVESFYGRRNCVNE